MDALVARQAIFDRQRKLYGYELLFRSQAANNAFDGTEAAAATMQVISTTLLSIGADQLLDGKKAFINFDHRLLSANMHLSLPPASLVIEILETVVPTEDLFALCQNIQLQGYSVALDDFIDQPDLAPLAGIANLIKVDMLSTCREEQERLLQTYKPRGVVMLAEKVESQAEFDWALDAGYDLFQGYFFARPVMVQGHQIPAVKTTCLQLLREVHQPDLDFDRVARLIRADVSLTYKLLRYANSALFQRSAKTESIPRALLTLGEDSLRRWVALVTLPALATNKPSELVKLSLVRARFCEQLSQLAGRGRPNETFLMGMFSLLDALIDQPLDEALRRVALGKEITDVLLGTAPDDGFLNCLYQLIRSYELGNWDEVDRLSEACKIPSAAISEAYLDSTVWAQQVISPP